MGIKVLATVVRPCQVAEEECVTIPRQVGVWEDRRHLTLYHLPCLGLLPPGPHRVPPPGLARALPRLGVSHPAQAHTLPSAVAGHVTTCNSVTVYEMRGW